MKTWGKASWLGVAGACLILVLFAAPAPAEAQVMGICAGWMESANFPPGSLSSDCTLETPALPIGTTTNPNPTFNIAINDAGVASDVILLALIPQTSMTGVSSLTFDATFMAPFGAPGCNTVGGCTSMVSASAFNSPTGPPYLWTPNNQLLVSSYLGLPTPNTGSDYHFDNINNLQIMPGIVGYSVYVMDTGFGVLGPTLTSGPTLIDVSFSNFSSGSGFPAGTFLLALGLDSQGNVIYFTPLTVGLEIVPEPTTMLLMGSGLAGLGLLRRRRQRRPNP